MFNNLNFIFFIFFLNFLLIFFGLIGFSFKRNKKNFLVLMVPVSCFIFLFNLNSIFNFFLSQYLLFLIFLCFCILLLIKNWKIFLNSLKDNFWILLIQLLFFNLFWVLSFFLTNGTFITGYFICNDPVNIAFTTRSVSNGLLMTGYPMGLFNLSSFFYLFYKDIPVVDFMTVAFLFSYLVFPLDNFLDFLKTKINLFFRFLFIFLIIFSYLSFNFLYYGFFAQTTSIPFIFGSMLLLFYLIKKPTYKSLLFFVLLLSTAANIYSFTVFPYLILELFFIFIFFKKIKLFFINFFKIKKIYLLVSLLIILPTLFPSLSFFTTLFSSSNKEINVSGIMGNLVGYLPIWQVFGVWPFADYRLPQDYHSLRGLSTIFVFIINSLIIISYLFFNKKERKKSLVFLFTFLSLGLFLRFLIRSPYVLSKYQELLSLFLIMLFLVAFSFLFKKTKKIFIKIIMSSYFCFYILLMFFSSFLALKWIPILTFDQKKELVEINNIYSKNYKKYFGQNDWFLFYSDSENTESINTHYQKDLFNKSFSNVDYLIFDIEQPEILKYLSEDKCLVYDGKYFVVLDNGLKKCGPNKSIYGLYKNFTRKDFDGVTIINQDLNKYVSLNPNSNESCSFSIKNDLGDINIGFRKDAVGKLTDGVNVFLMSENGEKTSILNLNNNSKIINFSHKDYLNKKICFDILGSSSYDWIIIGNLIVR